MQGCRAPHFFGKLDQDQDLQKEQKVGSRSSSKSIFTAVEAQNGAMDGRGGSALEGLKTTDRRFALL